MKPKQPDIKQNVCSAEPEEVSVARNWHKGICMHAARGRAVREPRIAALNTLGSVKAMKRVCLSWVVEVKNDAMGVRMCESTDEEG